VRKKKGCIIQGCTDRTLTNVWYLTKKSRVPVSSLSLQFLKPIGFAVRYVVRWTPDLLGWSLSASIRRTFDFDALVGTGRVYKVGQAISSTLSVFLPTHARTSTLTNYRKNASRSKQEGRRCKSCARGRQADRARGGQERQEARGQGRQEVRSRCDAYAMPRRHRLIASTTLYNLDLTMPC